MSLRLEGIEKRFVRQLVARAIFLEAHRGELVWISGANGAGKSTMLRIAAGLCRPDRGQVFLGPIDLYSRKRPRDRSLALRSIGAYLGSGFLYTEFSARENLRFYAKLLGVSRSEEALRKLADEFDFGSFIDRPIAECSAGMRKRVALARTFLASPAVMLLDEPFAFLDDAGVSMLESALQRRVREGAAVVVAGHERNVRERIATRTFYLDRGILCSEEAA